MPEHLEEEDGDGREDSNGMSDRSDPPAPLFPLLLSSSAGTSSDTQWLRNPSFTFDASALRPSGGGGAGAPVVADSYDEASEEVSESRPPVYEPVASPRSPSPLSSDEHKSRREKKRRKKSRKREREGDDDRMRSRKTGVRAWAGSDAGKPAKDYYFHTEGDRDNLAFGSLYRMDVARFKRHPAFDSWKLESKHLYKRRHLNFSVELDRDLEVLDSQLRDGGRYFSPKYASFVRNKDFKFMKFAHRRIHSSPGSFIPLVELQSPFESDRSDSSLKGEENESWEDEKLRRTREFNKMTRELPHDENVWIEFAEFQDKIASMQPQKAARRQTLEKKISILEKAVELNFKNENLLLLLLKSYQRRDTADTVVEKWEKSLFQHSDSVLLWKEFLQFSKGEYSRFKVSDTRKTYLHAIQALSSACNKLRRQGQQKSLLQSTDDATLVQLELGLVDIFINLCRFEWQAGYQELATALLQAELEFILFSPSLFLSEQSKLRLFEHFWNSGGSRVGEDGALGWSTWLEKEDQNRPPVSTEGSLDETEPGGWTGWFDPSLTKNDSSKELEELKEHLDEDNDEGGVENADIHAKDDVEELLRNLGINMDAESNSEIKDSKTWIRWSEEEFSRESKQWMPIREQHGDHDKPMATHCDDNMDREVDEDLSRVILFEDISENLFSVCSKEAQFSFLSQFVDFYGGKIARWTCTNDSSWIEKVLSLDMLPDTINQDYEVAFEMTNGASSCLSRFNLYTLLVSADDSTKKINMMKFVQNAILLCMNIFPRNYVLEESVLSTESLIARNNSSTGSGNPSRRLAKFLLKNDRQDLLLCGLYARSEAMLGNIELARQIFDMALSSIDGLSVDMEQNIPLLFFWYAEMEMTATSSDRNSELYSERSIHVLSCLGGGFKYTPFNGAPSGLQILRARQGFREKIRSFRSAWACGNVKEYYTYLICSATLFEILTTGYSTGIEVIEEAFSMCLPERRSRSSEHERLWLFYIGLMEKHLKKLKFPLVSEKIERGLQMYPHNPIIFKSMIEFNHLYSTPFKIRCIFDQCSQRKPSVMLCLYAVLFELSNAGSENRIRGIFERALADEKLQKSVLIWRCYLAYELNIACNPSSSRRTYFRAIHACPWSKTLWLDGFQKLGSILSVKELSDLHEVMRDKEINLRTDIYEILLQDELDV